jgi:hypothetical protein
MPEQTESRGVIKKAPHVSHGSLMLCWTREAGLRASGLVQRKLADGRTCLIWAKGGFFDSGDHLRVDDEIAGWLADQLNAASFMEIAPRMNGCFAAVVVWPEAEYVEIGSDRLAPIPIYAHVDSSRLLLSNDFWSVAEASQSLEYDCDAVLSMVVAEYVVRPRTLLKGISVLANAAIHRISWDGGVVRLASDAYWSLAFGTEDHRSPEVWRQGLAETLSRVFRRYGHAIAARRWTAYVPLSGGQDSRLSLGLLHRHGAQPRAFSYGPSGNDESLVASQVAKALGVPFRFVPIDDPSFLTPELVRTMARRVGMRARFTAGLGPQLSLGDYSPTDAFLPSHPGGLVPIGPESHVSFLVRIEEQAVQQLVDNWFLPVLEEMGAALFPAIWRPDTKRRIVRSNWDFDPKDALGSMQRWEWSNRHQIVLSELRTYELSGHWLLPTADYEFTDFYHPVPAQLRYEKRLYTDAMIHNLFVDDLAPLREVRLAFSNGFEVPPLSWKDKVLMNVPLGPLGDLLLRRATRTKLREHLRTIGEHPKRVSGPDPIDYWWLTNPSFRVSVTEMFRGWDGMGGMLDVSALEAMLKGPLPGLFVRLGIPALLTLRAFQDIVEDDLGARP